MSINEKWHDSHVMPKNPTVEQRIAWHLAHEKHCDCRPIPAKLRQLIATHQKSSAKPRARK